MRTKLEATLLLLSGCEDGHNTKGVVALMDKREVHVAEENECSKPGMLSQDVRV